jgi:hypothetical protein
MKCELCKEETNKLYKHHIIPRSKGGKYGDILHCCHTCNSQVHMLFTNNELANMSLDELFNSPEIQKYIKWKKKHPGKHRLKSSKKVRKWQNGHR